MLYICVLMLFFFKQKTAYEMRISDWSSDVCSSDLNSGVVLESAPGCLAVAKSRTAALHQLHLLADRLNQGFYWPILREVCRGAGIKDRKSVVEGKSVSVRVDLGGRRIINKKQI